MEYYSKFIRIKTRMTIIFLIVRGAPRILSLISGTPHRAIWEALIHANQYLRMKNEILFDTNYISCYNLLLSRWFEPCKR